MKSLRIATVRAAPGRIGILAAIFMGVLVIVALRCRSTYSMQPEDPAASFSVAPLDERGKAFLAEVQRTWVCTQEGTNGLFSTLLQGVGLNRSARNATDVLSSPTPRRSWWRPSQAARSAMIASVKAGLLDIAANPQIQVSDDRHVALVSLGTVVFILEDGANGLQEARYLRKEEALSPVSLSTGPSSVADSSAVTESPVVGSTEKDDVRQLQGQWLLVSGASYGLPLPGAGQRPAVRKVFNGDEVTTIGQEGSILKEKFTIDPSRAPKMIDFEMISASATTIKRLGIYELDGDSLRLCLAGPRSARPVDFSGRDGVLTVWKRENPVSLRGSSGD